jgi:3-oxoadipate enol-lactonase
MPFLDTIAGTRIHYLDENPTGRASIVLLHGLGANCTSWQLQIPPLTQAGFRVIAPDAPGFGKSTYPGGNTSIASIASRIAELIQTLGIDSCNVVGISMGGTLALQLAIDHPETIQKMVLVNTFARLQVENIRILPYVLLRLILVHTLGLPAQAHTVARRIFPHPDQEFLRQELINQITQADVHAYRATMRALGRFDVRKWLCEIRCPTLVITGEADNTVPPPNQDFLAQSIPGAKQIYIPQAGHAVSVEKPDQFNSLLLEFLQSG